MLDALLNTLISLFTFILFLFIVTSILTGIMMRIADMPVRDKRGRWIQRSPLQHRMRKFCRRTLQAMGRRRRG